MKLKFVSTSIAVISAMLVSQSIKAETVVTTYVTKVQEERQTTRWTLTEWLRIKERMQMMDLWLAMFSDPKKDRFRPELVVSYSVTKGTVEKELANGTESASARSFG
jgi:hypothetical protein